MSQSAAGMKHLQLRTSRLEPGMFIVLLENKVAGHGMHFHESAVFILYGPQPITSARSLARHAAPR